MMHNSGQRAGFLKYSCRLSAQCDEKSFMIKFNGINKALLNLMTVCLLLPTAMAEDNARWPARENNLYSTRPRKAFIAGRAKTESTARYLENFRARLEQVGNQHFPTDAQGRRHYGSLQVTVGIRRDGTLDDVMVESSSGDKVVDDAIGKIVRLAAPFAALPASIGDITGKPADILYITRTWTFSPDDKNVPAQGDQAIAIDLCCTPPNAAATPAAPHPAGKSTPR